MVQERCSGVVSTVKLKESDLSHNNARSTHTIQTLLNTY